MRWLAGVVVLTVMSLAVGIMRALLAAAVEDDGDGWFFE